MEMKRLGYEFVCVILEELDLGGAEAGVAVAIFREFVVACLKPFDDFQEGGSGGGCVVRE